MVVIQIVSNFKQEIHLSWIMMSGADFCRIHLQVQDRFIARVKTKTLLVSINP